MHKLIEDYLAKMEASLSPLPTVRRNEELREIRSHLLNAVIVNQEIMGMPEDEAVKSAIEEFGESTEFSHGAIKAWQNEGRAKNTRFFWLAATCIVTLSVYEATIHPRYLWNNLFAMIFGLILVGWKYLSPAYRPAWWAFNSAKVRPISRFSLVLYTVLTIITNVLVACDWKPSPSHTLSRFSGVAWSVIVISGLWHRYYQEQRARAKATE